MPASPGSEHHGQNMALAVFINRRSMMDGKADPVFQRGTASHLSCLGSFCATGGAETPGLVSHQADVKLTSSLSNGELMV